MKEAPQSPYKPVFRETFTDEASVRRNGGTPTAVTFENGSGIFTASYINYKSKLFNLPNATIRIRFKARLVGWNCLLDFRGTAPSGDGEGRILLNNTGTISTASPIGTVYKNGVLGSSLSTYSAGEYVEFVFAGIALKTPSNNNNIIGIDRGLTGDTYRGEIDLIEIYSGTLTPSEVANLYNDRQDTELTGYGGQGGNNLIPTYDFNTWDPILSPTIDNATTFTTTGVGGVALNTILTIGKRYRIIVEGTGSTFTIRNSNINANIISNDFGNFVFTAVEQILYFRNSGAGTTNITNIVLQELQPDLLMDFNSTNGVLSLKGSGVE
jgi:hypothetical protein